MKTAYLHITLVLVYSVQGMLPSSSRGEGPQSLAPSISPVYRVQEKMRDFFHRAAESTWKWSNTRKSGEYLGEAAGTWILTVELVQKLRANEKLYVSKLLHSLQNPYSIVVLLKTMTIQQRTGVGGEAAPNVALTFSCFKAVKDGFLDFVLAVNALENSVSDPGIYEEEFEKNHLEIDSDGRIILLFSPLIATPDVESVVIFDPAVALRVLYKVSGREIIDHDVQLKAEDETLQSRDKVPNVKSIMLLVRWEEKGETVEEKEEFLCLSRCAISNTVNTAIVNLNSFLLASEFFPFKIKAGPIMPAAQPAKMPDVTMIRNAFYHLLRMKEFEIGRVEKTVLWYPDTDRSVPCDLDGLVVKPEIKNQPQQGYFLVHCTDGVLTADFTAKGNLPTELRMLGAVQWLRIPCVKSEPTTSLKCQVEDQADVSLTIPLADIFIRVARQILWN